MKTDEIVGALRSCSNHDTRKPDCENCPLFGERFCVKQMLEGGANLIETLQKQLTEAINWADLLHENMALTASSRGVREGYERWRKSNETD